MEKRPENKPTPEGAPATATPRGGGGVHPKAPVRLAIWKTMARLGVTGMHGLPVSRRWVHIHRGNMNLRGLHPALSGLRIIQISDLHYSPVVWKSYIEQYLDFVNALRPDLVVVTGDLITGGYRYAGRIAKILRRLQAPRGVVCTSGNHDYSMWGKRSPTQATRRGDYLEAAIEAEGIHVLRNEVLRVSPDGTTRQYKCGDPRPDPDGSLVIVGLDDEWTGKLDAGLAFSCVHPDEAILCLNHNPINTRELLVHPWQWMLAGHTHGRQLGHKGWSKAILASKIRQFTHGYYAVDGRHLYVNRGMSYGQRVTEFARPEVTLFRLRAEGDDPKSALSAESSEVNDTAAENTPMES